MLLEKLVDGTMFPRKMMKQFYPDPTDKEKLKNLSDELKDAYYIFIKDFATCTSKHWRKYLNNLKDGNGTYHSHFTLSDEVFTFWFIYHQYEEEEHNAKEIHSMGREKWAEIYKSRPKGGEQFVKKNLPVYIKMYEMLKAFRDEGTVFHYFEKLFWEKFNQNKKSRKKRSIEDQLIEGKMPSAFVVPDDFS